MAFLRESIQEINWSSDSHQKKPGSTRQTEGTAWFTSQSLGPQAQVSQAELGQQSSQGQGTAATEDTVLAAAWLIPPLVPLPTGALYRYQGPGSPCSISGCPLAPDTRPGRTCTRENKRASRRSFHTRSVSNELGMKHLSLHTPGQRINVTQRNTDHNWAASVSGLHAPSFQGAHLLLPLPR